MVSPRLPRFSRVKAIPYGIPHQIKRNNRNEEDQAGEKNQVRVKHHRCPAVFGHTPPGGKGRGDPEADETER